MGLLWLDHCGLGYHSIHHIPHYAILYSTILTEMVHSCAVLGCKNRSNKECKGLKFYTLPFRNEELLKTWLALICRRQNEVTIHSRVCSAHFAGGIKSDSLPQTFPWQKCIPTQAPAPAMIPSDIVDHDHCYCPLDFHSPSIVVHPGSSLLTRVIQYLYKHLDLQQMQLPSQTSLSNLLRHFVLSSSLIIMMLSNFILALRVMIC